MPNISGLATNAALTAVENKKPYISSLVKKNRLKQKITETEKKLTDHNHDKYITTQEFNTFTASVFNTRYALANLVTKTDFDSIIAAYKTKITSNENELKKRKHLIRAILEVGGILKKIGHKII